MCMAEKLIEARGAFLKSDKARPADTPQIVLFITKVEKTPFML